jgi:hypothetical protein
MRRQLDGGAYPGINLFADRFSTSGLDEKTLGKQDV